MLFGDEPRFHKDLKATFAGGSIYAHVEVIQISFASQTDHLRLQMITFNYSIK